MISVWHSVGGCGEVPIRPLASLLLYDRCILYDRSGEVNVSVAFERNASVCCNLHDGGKVSVHIAPFVIRGAESLSRL